MPAFYPQIDKIEENGSFLDTNRGNQQNIKYAWFLTYEGVFVYKTVESGTPIISSSCMMATFNSFSLDTSFDFSTTYD